MKRFISILVMLLVFSVLEGRAQNELHTASHRPTYYGYEYRQLKRNSSIHIDTGESLYQQIKIDDATSFLFDKDGRFQYIGGIRLSSNGKYFPSGEGVSRSVVTNPETGGTELRYDLGPWKRGSRHGVFLVKLPDGTYCQERWKWNRFKGVLPDEPSSDDIARLEESAVRLETMLRITDR